ncbi:MULTISPECIES: hypothetical protein [Pseudomonas]|uniref:hypothetical protein n=1 Tax=Pseudomonas TaxID=286 RepID=UPI0014756470|nr:MULTISPECIES: hypothetical protein [Pseudomonas]MBM1188663.1 hypothetical protein [Pseudomonas lundensis]NMY96531.1 hypothetical protein [Pseudomonas proteolytica]
MERLNGWQRLWELMKWLAAIGIGLYVAFITVESLQTAALEFAPTTPQPSPGQILIGGFMAGIFIGGATFGILHALEWVYRGFRPLPIAPTEADQPSPLGVPEAPQEPRLALGHQENQQNSSALPTPLREPVQRE